MNQKIISLCGKLLIVPTIILSFSSSSFAGNLRLDISDFTQENYGFSKASEETIFFEDFESGWDDWYPSMGVWDVGIPTTGPDSAHSGQNCAGTILGGNYINLADTRLISPEITIPTLSPDERVYIRFWHWFDMYHSYDKGQVQISVDGGDWQTISREYTYYSSMWTYPLIDISSYAGSTIRIAFYFRSNGYDTDPGWYVDNVLIIKREPLVFYNPEDWEQEWHDWYTDNGVWEVGVPTYGPGSAYSGQNCAGTVLGGNYPNYADARLISPEITLTPAPEEDPCLRFWHWFQMDDPDDKGRVQISVDGGDWQTISDDFFYSSGGWSPSPIISLSDYENLTVRIAFYFTSDHSNTYPGWYVDDILIEGIAPPHPIDVSPPNLPLGNVLVGEISDSLYFTISNVSDSIVVINSITAQDSCFKIKKGSEGNWSDSIYSFPIDSTDSQDIYVRFEPSDTLEYEDNIVIIYNDSSEVNVNVSGRGVKPEIEVLPTSLSFGNVYIGDSSSEQIFTINNIGDGTLKVHSIISPICFRIKKGSEGTWGDSILSFNISPSDREDIYVIFEPSDTLEYEDSVIISSNDSNEDTVFVIVNGIGIERPLFIPFYDGFENGLGNWEISGLDWDTTSTTCRSGSYSITDSPEGDYSQDANAIITLSGYINLSTSIGPVLSFWHKYFIAGSDHGYVEISTNEGWTWSELQSYNGFQSTWTKEQINLNDYNTYSQVKIRFRLSDDGCCTESDGWYIDDVEIKEWDPGPQLLLPLCDGFENELDNWEISGCDWDTTSTTCRSGSYSITDSPEGDYSQDANAIITLSGYINLSTSIGPVLSFWHKYFIAGSDHGYVEISTNEGWTWSELQSYNGFQSTWTKEQINLNDYDTYSQVKIRFRLSDDGCCTESDGWYIDDVTIEGELPPGPIINVLPTNISFGEVLIGESSNEESFIISNFGDSTLVIDPIKAPDDFEIKKGINGTWKDSIQTFNIFTSFNQDIYVRFKPTMDEEYEDNIVIISNAVNEDTVYVIVSGRGVIPEPEITVTPTSLSFDDVFVGEESNDTTFTINNTGNDTLEISLITTPPGFMTKKGTAGDWSNSISDFTIVPLNSEIIFVKFIPELDTTYSGNIVINNNDDDENPTNVSVSGNGLIEPKIEVSTSSLFFGNIYVGEESEDSTFIISNIGNDTLEISLITAPPGFMTKKGTAGDWGNSISAFTIVPLNSEVIYVKFIPELDTTYSGNIVIYNNDNDTTVSVSGNGIIEPKIEVSTSSLSFGDIYVGEESEDSTFIISNVGNGNLEISSITVPYGFIIKQGVNGSWGSSISSFIISPDSQQVIYVKFKPPDMGPYSGNIEINNNDSDTTVFVSGNGVATDISVYPTSLSFGDVYVGEESEIKSFTISNEGNINLEINSIKAPNDFRIKREGDNWVNSISIFYISPDSQKVIHVKFIPIEKKTYLDTITIISNDSNYNTLYIDVYGTALSAIPNAFTPNGDGKNDVFSIGPLKESGNFQAQFMVYDLQSKKIHETEGPASQPLMWDGKDDSGKECRSDIYIYVYKKDGKIVERGKIYLIR